MGRRMASASSSSNKAPINSTVESPVLQGCPILVVEDEPLLVLGIELAFEHTGAILIDAGSLEHALVLVEEARISAAIVDHQLVDGMSGPLYRRLTEREIPFVVYSAHDVPITERRGATLISKPALPEMLVAAVEGLCAADRPEIFP